MLAKTTRTRLGCGEAGYDSGKKGGGKSCREELAKRRRSRRREQAGSGARSDDGCSKQPRLGQCQGWLREVGKERLGQEWGSAAPDGNDEGRPEEMAPAHGSAVAGGGDESPRGGRDSGGEGAVRAEEDGDGRGRWSRKVAGNNMPPAATKKQAGAVALRRRQPG